MSSPAPHITCIGLANVDVIAGVDDDFIVANKIAKGATTLLDSCAAGNVLAKLDKPEFYPGGGAANAACGISSFGLPVSFIGKTGDDIYAEIFRKGFAPYDIRYDVPPYGMKMTSTCLTLITPDKDRSFALCTDTAGWCITPEDLPDLPHEENQFVYLETNTARMPVGGKKNVLRAAVEKYSGTGIKIIVNLNDSEIVKASKETLKDILSADIHFFIGNVYETLSLFDTDDLALVCEFIWGTGRNFAITNGADGAYLVMKQGLTHMPAIDLPESRIVNTVGAGDQFAAGFIAGLALGKTEEEACRMGLEASGKILQEASGRPRVKGRAA